MNTYVLDKKLVKGIASAVHRFVDSDTYAVFIFGSRARGDNRARSDIDIGIEGPQKIPSYTLAEIREALDQLPTLLSFDVVDFHSASKKFKREALTYTKKLL